MNIEGNKIGGASLPDAHSIKEYIPNVVKSFKTPSFLVVSAFKDRTNRLEVLANEIASGNFSKAEQLFHSTFNDHFQVVYGLLPIPNCVAASMSWEFFDLFKKIDSLKSYNSGIVYDQVVSYGEVVSSKILSGYLNHLEIRNKFIDARDIIVTDSNWRNAKVDLEETAKKVGSVFTEEFWKENPLVVMGGFIGRTFYDGKWLTTTLGREGSDTTAAVMAYLLGASRMNYWKDVDGLYDSNPKTNPNAKFIDRASYKEVRKMKEEGRVVGLLHDNAFDLLEEKGIIYSIRNTKTPKLAGTVIGA